MTDSSPDTTLGRRREALKPPRSAVLLASGLALALWLAPAAWAQSTTGSGSGLSQPLNQPTIQSQPVGEPIRLVPLDPARRQGTGALPNEALPQVQGIAIDRLEAIDPNAIGIVDALGRGLDANLWRGSNRSRIEALMVEIPGEITSITMRDLARRLLLSSAPPPTGDARGQDEAAGPRLLSLRIDRLSALGEIDALAQLLDAVPRQVNQPEILRARAETHALRGDFDSGCREVRNGVAAQVGSAYWQKALVICQLVAGERAQAQLGIDLLREQGLAEDPGFLALSDALSGFEAEVPLETAAHPLHFAAMQAIGQPLPAGFADQAPPSVLVAMARNATTAAEPRAVAAERMLAVGGVAGENLIAAYSAFEFSHDELMADAGSRYEGVRQRALSYQRVGKRGDPAQRARSLREALNGARGDGLYQAMLRTLLGEIQGVPLHPSLAWFAQSAGRALFAAGRLEGANAWYAMARGQAQNNSEARVAAARLWPYLRLSGGPTLGQSASLAAWRDGLGGTDPVMRRRWESLLRATFQALGQDGSVSLVEIAAESGGSGLSASGPLVELREASEAGRTGETLLIALNLLGGADLETVQPLVLNGVLSALTRVGLEPEARALAVEVAVANWI